MRLLATTLGVALALAGQFGQRPRVLPLGAPLQIAAVTPPQGPIAGGTVIVLGGAGFTGATVRIDSQIVTPLSQSDTSIQLRMPAHDNGYVTISARSDSGVAYGRFLYIPPRLDEIPPGYITTVAGVGTFKNDFGPATAAVMNPANIVFDRAGNLYVGEPQFDAVSRIRTDGVIERYASVGTAGAGSVCCGDGGPATSAYVAFPRGIAIDPQDNLYIADHGYYIRRVDAATGVITTVAGTGRRAYSGDGGPAARADISLPTYLATDGAELFFIDIDANRIRKIDVNGRISTFAGNGARGFSGDGGPATAASFDINDSDTGALAMDASSVYFADVNNNRIRKIDRRSGIISTLVQTGAGTGALSAGLIFSLAVDKSGNVYYGGTRLVEVSPAGQLMKSWGSSTLGFSPDGTPIDQMLFIQITGLTFDAAGNVVYAEQASGRVRRLNQATGRVETLAGIAPAAIGEEGPAVAAPILDASNGDVAVTRSGDLLIADGRVRRVTAAGLMSTMAGHALSGTTLGVDNVPAYDAPITVWHMILDATDEIDAVFFGGPVYHIDRAGIVHLLVGRNGPACGYTGDGGPAVSATLCQPYGAARDADGNLFIADMNNNRIRRVDARTGVMTTFAGAGPISGKENRGRGSFCGDGGPARDACFNAPYSVAFDPEGNLFVSDWANARIRKIDRNGIITTVIQFPETYGAFTIRFDRAGNLYTALGDRLVRFGRSGVMTTIAGTAGKTGFAGDGGPALQARMTRGPGQNVGIAIDNDGDVFFVDPANSRVRAVRQGATIGLACAAPLEPPSFLRSAVSGSTVTLAWNFSSGATSYIVEAGSASGARDLATMDTGNPAVVFVASGVASGTYYVRVRATGPCGLSSASGEAVVRVP